MEQVILIENARMRLKLKKIELCRLADITPAMYSYVMKNGRIGNPLPEECVGKIMRALAKREKKKP